MIYFISVNYFSTALIEKLINSIQSTNSDNYKLLIINNSPEDDSINRLGNQFSWITIIDAGKNLGFGAGCNLGIQAAYRVDSKALIWLINPDAVLDLTAIAYVEACFQQDPSLAILGTKVRDTRGEIWFSSGTFNPWTGSLKHQFKVPELVNSPIGTTPCRWVSGCSLIINLARFDHCPSFSSAYFLYYEDSDLCERYYQRGYPIAVTNVVLVTHAVSAITERNKSSKFQHATYSKLYFLSQHGTPLALLLNLIYLSLLVTVLLTYDRPAARGRWQGLKNFIRWVLYKQLPLA